MSKLVNSTILNRYKLAKVLGKGTYGTVYAAFDTKLDTQKAIKLIYDTKFGLLEAKKLIKLNHPNITRIYDAGITNEFIFIDMELIQANTLKEFLKNSFLKNSDAEKVAYQLAKALAYTHKQNIVHNDVKPGNIFIDDNYNIKLSDFGLAQGINEKGHKLGTVAYMATERYTNPKPNFKSDVFSFGVILYQLLYNEYPFENKSTINYKIPTHIQSSSNYLDKLIVSCLQQNSALRPSFKQIVKILKPKNVYSNSTRLFAASIIFLILAILLIFLPLTNTKIKAPKKFIITHNFKKVNSNKLSLKKGDVLSFYDKKSNSSTFDFIKTTNKNTKIEFKNNNFYINDTLNSVHQKNINSNFAYIKIDTSTTKKSLAKIKAKNVCVSFSKNAPQKLLSQLPKQTKYINLSNNISVNNVSSINIIKNLQAVNLNNAKNVNLKTLPYLQNLKLLSIQNIVKNKSLILRYYPNLNTIDVSNNNVSSIKIPNKKNIKFINYSNSDVSKKYINQNFKNANKSQFNLSKHIKIIILILFLIGLIFAVLALFKKNKNSSKDIQPESKDPTKNHINKFKQLLKDKKFFTPKNSNAFSTLQSLKNHVSAKEHSNQANTFKKAIKHKIKKLYKNKKYLLAYNYAKEVINKFSKDDNKEFTELMQKNLTKLEENKNFTEYTLFNSGKFVMGDFTAKSINTDAPAHVVSVSSFKLSKSFVSNYQFCTFLNEKGNKTESGTLWYNIHAKNAKIKLSNGTFEPVKPYAAFPVCDVSWYGALRYCQFLGGRLPTEAELEYALRGEGKKILYPFGNKLKNIPNEVKKSNFNNLMPVKSIFYKHINLYDACFSLKHWCLDIYSPTYYKNSSFKNPLGPAYSNNSNILRVIRGSSYNCDIDKALVYNRMQISPNTRNNEIGFRVAKPPK